MVSYDRKSGFQSVGITVSTTPDSGCNPSRYIHKYSGVARDVLEALLDKYMNEGITEIEKTEVLKLDPFRRMGNPVRIAKLFGGKEGYLQAVKELEDEIYRIG